MLSQIYDFTDRMLLKYNFYPFHQHRRPYTYDQLLQLLKFFQKQDLGVIERQQVLGYLQYFSDPQAILTYDTDSYQFNLNLEPGLFFTQRTSSISIIAENEYAWQIRPIASGQINDGLVFSTDLRFFLVAGQNLSDTVRTEVEVGQPNEPAFDTAGLAPSYLQFELPWFDLLIGKQNLSWGPGRYGNLLLSAHAMPMEMIHTTGDYGKVAFQAFHAIGQSTYGNKVVSGHRIDLNPFPRLRLGISEIVVIGTDKFDPRLLNPVTIYAVSEASGAGYYGPEGEFSQGNVLVSGDASLNLRPSIQAYMEVMVDDFQPRYRWQSHLHWASKWGILAGVQVVDPLLLPNTDLRLEYAFLNQYTYTHITPVNTYTQLERPIGHHIGPDAQSLWVQFQHQWTARFSTGLSFEIQHQGEQGVNQSRDRSRPADEHWVYLSGTEEIRHTFGLYARIAQPGRWLLDSSYQLTRIRNADHHLGITENQQELRLIALYRF